MTAIPTELGGPGDGTTAGAMAPAGRRIARATRNMSALMHMHPELARKAVREFLAEDRRALDPHPGADPAAVLTEAVASCTRARIRDGALVAIGIGVLVLNTVLFLVWLTGALLARLVATALVERTTSRQLLTTLFSYATGLAAAVLFLGVAALDLGGGLVAELADDASRLFQASEEEFVVLLASAALVVLALDHWVQFMLVTRSFAETLRPDQLRRAWPGEFFARTLGTSSFRERLDRIAERHDEQDGGVPALHGDRPDGGATVRHVLTVHAGNNPFLGSGDYKSPWSVAVRLVPAEEPTTARKALDAALGPDSKTVDPFKPSELYDHVAAAVEKISRSPSFSPEGNYRDIRETRRIVASAIALLTHASTPVGRAILPDPTRAPVQHLPQELVLQIEDAPLEWVRSFRCFQLECWDGDLVLSAFLHVGCDADMLYLEWTPCVLYPIKPALRAAELAARTRTVRDVLLDWLLLPVDLAKRFDAARRPVYSRPLAPERGVTPRTYGVSYSLRELVADDETFTYFQLSDIARFQRVLTRTLMSSVVAFLDEHGYSSAELVRRVSTIIDNSMIVGSQIGDGNVMTNSTAAGNDISGSQPAGGAA